MRDNLNEYNGKMNKKNPKTNTYMSFFQCHCHYGWIITLDLRFQNVLIIFRLLARCSFHFFFLWRPNLSELIIVSNFWWCIYMKCYEPFPMRHRDKHNCVETKRMTKRTWKQSKQTLIRSFIPMHFDKTIYSEITYSVWCLRT